MVEETNLGFSDFACTFMPLVGTGIPEGSVGFELAFCISDFAGCLVGNRFGKREGSPCCLGCESIAL